MAGSISLSLSQQFDTQGRPLSGGKLYFFASGTSTPQSAYQDSGLTIAHANPIILDASGRVAAFYLADGFIKIRLTDSAGSTTIIAADALLVIGPSSGSGGAGGVDPLTIFATGDVKAKYGTGVLSGFVRLNGRTMGSATSGASERANADAQALFEYLWTADANLVVSTGRGGSANADWVANKTITLPDFRGRIPAALDDMGNSAAGRLTSTYFGSSGIVLGQTGGAESKTLVTGNLPAYTPSGSVGVTDSGHQHKMFKSGTVNSNTEIAAGQTPSATTTNPADANLGARIVAAGAGPDVGLTENKTAGITSSFTGTAQGGISTPVAIVPPMVLLTYYCKL